MTKTKSTKRALLMSALSLLMCISMFIGSTFAWFTDSVTSANNVIQSGTLDVVLEYKTNWSDEWAPVNENTKLFKDGALYEPGYTEVVYLRVSNAGSLALKYMLSFNIANEEGSTNVYGEEFKLSDYLQIGSYVQDEYSSGFNYANTLMPIMFGNRDEALKNVDLNTLSSVYTNPIIRDNAPLLPGEETAQVYALVLTMPETVGNEANTKVGVEAPYIELGIRLYATQYTHEEDSIDNQYDAGADFPTIPGKFNITNAEELDEALAAEGVGTVLNSFADAFGKVDAENEFVLDLNGQSVTGGTVATGDVDGGDAAFENSGKLTIKNGTINSDYITVDNKAGALKLEDLTLNTSDILYGFYQRSGESILNNVDIVAIRGGMNISGGKVTINDGSMSIKGKSSKTGYHFYVYGETTEIVINGGDYTYSDGYRNYGVIYATNGAKVIINGGRFEDGGKSYSTKWLQALNGATITIYGGSFEFDPSAFVAEGYEAVKGADGWWTVSKIAG